MSSPMPLSRSERRRVYAGSVLLALALLGLVLLLTSSEVTRPAGRIASALGSALVAERDDDLVQEVSTTDGLMSGLPAYVVDAAGDARPVAHVVSYGTRDGRDWVRLRFEPGEAGGDGYDLRVYPPDRTLGAAIDVAVTPAAARRFGRDVARRLETLWQESLLPEAEEHLPDFLARIDPAQDTETRAVARGLAQAALVRLDPLLDELAADVTKAVRAKFDLLDRLGLLWKVVKGDADGLQREVLPVAKQAARTWWDAHEAEVVKALGAAVGDEIGSLEAWVGGELFDAARTELVEPILTAQRERLEDEGEAILRRAADEFVRAPGGGFRVRFASLLRTQLLRKDSALLLLQPKSADR